MRFARSYKASKWRDVSQGMPKLIIDWLNFISFFSSLMRHVLLSHNPTQWQVTKKLGDLINWLIFIYCSYRRTNFEQKFIQIIQIKNSIPRWLAAPKCLIQKHIYSYLWNQMFPHIFPDIAILLYCDGWDLALPSKIGFLNPSRWTRGYFFTRIQSQH